MKTILIPHKVLYLAIFFILFPIVSQAQESMYFSKVLTGISRESSNNKLKIGKINADKSGGILEMRVPNTAGTCADNLQFQWRFLDDISTLKKNQKYRFVIEGSKISGNCAPPNTNTAHIRSSSSGSKVADAAGIKSPANSMIMNGSKASFIVANARYDSQVKQTEGTLEFINENGIDESYVSFQFDFATFPYAPGSSMLMDFQVVYVFSKSSVPASSTINCGALYGMGVNIGILEYGSLENASSLYLSGFIDHAITGGKGSGCVSSADIAYLVDLKKRMLTTSTSGTFSGEISVFRQTLATKVAGCTCD